MKLFTRTQTSLVAGVFLLVASQQHVTNAGSQPLLKEELQSLLNAQDETNDPNFTPLHLAAKIGDCTAIENLLAQGSYLLSHDGQGLTPLHYAAGNGQISAVRVMLRWLDEHENNQELKATTIDSCLNILLATPLHFAASIGDPAVVEELLKHGANPNAQIFIGYTALHLAVEVGALEVIELLVTYKVDLEIRDLLFGATALHHAVVCEQPEAVALLLKSGANIEAGTSNGCTAIDLAQSTFQENIVSILQNFKK
jgi:ankyrin repeat protein